MSVREIALTLGNAPSVQQKTGRNNRKGNNMAREYTYIAIQSGGYYSDACIRKGYMTTGDCAVIEYSQFAKFMNEGEATRPMFTSVEYSVCIQVAKELNDSASQIAMKEYVAQENL